MRCFLRNIEQFRLKEKFKKETEMSIAINNELSIPISVIKLEWPPPPQSPSIPSQLIEQNLPAECDNFQENWTELEHYLVRDTNKIEKSENKSSSTSISSTSSTSLSSSSSTNNKKTKRVRTTFTHVQLAELEKEFNQDKYLNSNRVKDLSARLSLGTLQIKVWFKNRRRKLKIKEEKQNNLNFSNEKSSIDLYDSKILSTNSNMNNNFGVFNQMEHKFTTDHGLSSYNDVYDTNNNDETRQNQINEMTNNNDECIQNNKISMTFNANNLNKNEYNNQIFNNNNNNNNNNFLDAWNDYSNNHLINDKHEFYEEINLDNKFYPFNYATTMNNFMEYQNYTNGINHDYYLQQN